MPKLRAVLVALAMTASLPVLGDGPAAPAQPPPQAWGGLPPAALQPEPVLPTPAEWSFGDGFPRTSGTGRYLDGAYFWSDFVYDDHGALGPPVPDRQGARRISWGGYRYPEPAAGRNGADVFRAAVGLEPDATRWRLDWHTLIDPALPIAVFAFDTDADAGTGARAWPANTGLNSPGVDRALVVSSRTARLLDTTSGESTPLPVSVDTQARSFLVRVPRQVLPVGGRWTVRLATGLADGDGSGLQTLDLDHGALPGQPNAYNVAFRDYADEPPGGNPWFDRGQAEALSRGDVSGFAVTLDWRRLEGRDEDPEPLVKGHLTNRWYVSTAEPAQGIFTEPSAVPFEPNVVHGNRVQPYAVYVPTSYGIDGPPLPLTWMLHGGGDNHNGQLSINPRLLRGACEERGSLCASPFGRGPLGAYRGLAELDFWEVWHRLASSFLLDPERTTLGGYSMGGIGTFHFGQDHPDLFAALFVIMSSDAQQEPDPGLYFDLLDNLRWNPLYHMGAALDEPVPPPVLLLEKDSIDRLGYRYVYDVYLLEDHLTPAAKDDYGDLVAYLKTVGVRKGDPGHVTYRWYPATVDPELGLGPTGAWWLGDLHAREGKAVAQVDAVSAARPDPAVTPVRSTTPRPDGRPSPALRWTLEWQSGATPERRPSLALQLSNVDAVTLDLLRAGFAPGEAGEVRTTSDGGVSVGLAGLPADAEVTLDGARVASTGRVDVPEGDHVIGWRRQAVRD